MENGRFTKYRKYAARVGHQWNAIRHLMAMQHEVAGHRLTAINFKIKPDEILIILRKETPKGNKVSFISASSLDDGLDVLCQLIKNKQLKWKDDRYKNG